MRTPTIVDLNVFAKFFDEKNEGTPDFRLRKWIEKKNGVVVYTDAGKFAEELGDKKMLMYYSYRQSGNARLIRYKKCVKPAEDIIERKTICSNDKHILGLAYASNALVLYSEDTDLHKDFTDTEILPKLGHTSRAVYPYKSSSKKQRGFLEKRKKKCPRLND